MASSAAGASIDVVNEQARQALASGQPSDAQSLLEERYRSGEADNQTLFLLALATKEQGAFEASKKYLGELLARSPDAGRVKLELAEVYYRNGEPTKAKELLLEVKATNPPPRVGENIDAFLAFIESGVPREWSAFASIAQMYDTNVNQGPDLDTVLIYDLPFVLDRDAKRNRDWATIVRTGVHYNRAIDDRWAIQAGANLGYTDYRRLSNFDALTVSLWAGPSWRSGDWSFSVPYLVNAVRIGHKDDYYQIANGIAPQFGYQVSPRLQLQGSLSWQHKRFKEYTERNSRSTTFSPGMRYLIDNSSYISAGIYVGEERSGVRTSSNTSYGLELGYYKTFGRSWNIHVSPAYSRTDYRGIEMAYGESRNDERIDFSTTLGYLIEPWDTTLNLSFTYTKNHSSIEMYRYTRQLTTLSISKNF